MEIGDRIKLERKRRGLSQVKGCIEIGISLSSLANTEKGLRPGPYTGECIDKWLIESAKEEGRKQ